MGGGVLTVCPASEVNWKSQGSPGVLLVSHAEPNLLFMGLHEPPPPRMATAVMPPNPAVFCNIAHDERMTAPAQLSCRSALLHGSH